MSYGCRLRPDFNLFLSVLMLSGVLMGCEQGATEGRTPTVLEQINIEAIQSSPTVEIIPPTQTLPPITTPDVSTPADSTPTQRPTLAPDEWKSLPVIPNVSENTIAIYRRGLEMGNRPDAFSKVGDCESQTTWYLWDFDQGEGYYSLGPYTELQPVIDHFEGSFERLSLAARYGFTAASVMTPLWADREKCEKDESPLACELRIHQSSIVLITLGANDAVRPETFEKNMRRVIEYSIEQGVVPIMDTKADNREGGHQINETIAHLAKEYDIPLWNFWLAVQPLPDHGLDRGEDMVHLTWDQNYFDDHEAMKRAWPVRNLSALQVLDAVWRGVSE